MVVVEGFLVEAEVIVEVVVGFPEGEVEVSSAFFRKLCFRIERLNAANSLQNLHYENKSG